MEARVQRNIRRQQSHVGSRRVSNHEMGEDRNVRGWALHAPDSLSTRGPATTRQQTDGRTPTEVVAKEVREETRAE